MVAAASRTVVLRQERFNSNHEALGFRKIKIPLLFLSLARLGGVRVSDGVRVRRVLCALIGAFQKVLGKVLDWFCLGFQRDS